MEIGRYDEALEAAQRALVSDPEDTQAQCILAQAYLGQKQPEKALQAAETALALDPDGEWQHRLRAIALAGMGRPEVGLASAREAVRLDPTGVMPLKVLLDVELSLGELGSARDTAAKLLEAGPETVQAHDTVGRLCLRLGENQRAELHFRKAAEIAPTDALVLNNLGVALLRQRRHSQALQVFRASAEADPRNQVALDNIRELVRHDNNPLRYGRTPMIAIPVLAVFNSVRIALRPRAYRDLPAPVRQSIFPLSYYLPGLCVFWVLLVIGLAWWVEGAGVFGRAVADRAPMELMGCVLAVASGLLIALMLRHAVRDRWRH